LGRFEAWTFCILDVLELGRFEAWDVLRLRTFCILDVLELGRFGAGTLCLWTFCLWTLCLWTFCRCTADLATLHITVYSWIYTVFSALWLTETSESTVQYALEIIVQQRSLYSVLFSA
jgi:hypothetical protein